MDLTPVAARQLAKIFDKYPDKVGLRVFIQGGGCSGFEYNFELANAISEDDFVYDHRVQNKTLCLLVDELSSSLLQGATLDYKADLTGARFVVDNPHVSSQCSCGSSFSLG